MSLERQETCARLADAVQEILDGATPTLPPELESHRRECGACRSLCDAAERLSAGLRSSVRAPLSAEMTQRFFAAVLADRESPTVQTRNWRRLAVWVSVAAALLIGLGIIVQQFTGEYRSERVIAATTARTVAPTREPNSLDLRENLATASDAIVSLTRRTTEDVVEPTKGLLSIDMTAPWLKAPDRIPNAIDPAAQSLEEVRQGAAAGFEPMANSARRAFAMFTRDLPVDRPAKPGS